MDIHQMKYSQLQKLAKRYSIKANQKADVLRKQISKLLNEQSDEISCAKEQIVSSECEHVKQDECERLVEGNPTHVTGSPGLNPSFNGHGEGEGQIVKCTGCAIAEEHGGTLEGSSVVEKHTTIDAGVNDVKDSVVKSVKQRSGDSRLQVIAEDDKQTDEQSTSTDVVERRRDTYELESPSRESVERRERKRRRSGTYELESPSGESVNKKKVRRSSVEDLPCIDSSTDDHAVAENAQRDNCIADGRKEADNQQQVPDGVDDEQNLSSYISERRERKRRRSGTYELESPSRDSVNRKKVRLSSVEDLPCIDSSTDVSVTRRRRSGTYELESPSRESVSKKRVRLSAVEDLPCIDSSTVAGGVQVPSDGSQTPGGKDQLASLNGQTSLERDRVVWFTGEATTSTVDSSQEWMEQLMNRVNKAAEDQESEVDRRVEERMKELNSLGRPEKLSSKTPNFKKMHEKEFSKMTDITVYHQRRLQLSKKKQTTATSGSKAPAGSRIPFVATKQTAASTPLRKSEMGGAKIVKPIRGGATIVKPIAGGGGSSAVKVKPDCKASAPTTTASRSLFSPTQSSLNKMATNRPATPQNNRLANTPATMSARKTFMVGTQSKPAAIPGTASKTRQPLKSTFHNRKAFDVKESLKNKPSWKTHTGPLKGTSAQSSIVNRRMSNLQENAIKRKQLAMANRGLP